MNRYLAIAYALTIAIVAASVAIARGAFPQLDGHPALATSQLILMALLPTAVLAFKGTRRSVGKLRQALGYSLLAVDLFLSLNGGLMALILFSGVGRVAAA